MVAVLGVSVGASAVRMARPTDVPADATDRPDFELQSVDVFRARPEELAAESIGVALESRGPIEATGIAYRSAQHAKAIRVAMAGQDLANYQLVPEVSAILRLIEASGELEGLQTVAIYDLGSSGLSISVVDVERCEVRYAERTSEISGDYFDSLIREQQIASGRVAQPQTSAEYAVLDLLCRDAKHRLSASSAVAIPSPGGLVLLTRDNFDSLVRLAVETSARLTRDVVMRSDLHVQAIVAVGGGSHVPSVAAVLERWLGVPVIIPSGPETVAARGAALLARPVVPIVDSGAGRELRAARQRKSRVREISGAGLAVSSLAVVAAIGLTLGYGGQMIDGFTDSGESPTTTLPQVPRRTTVGEPSIAVAPIPTFVNLPTTTTTDEPPPGPSTTVRIEVPTTPPPPSIDVPGIGPIILTPPPLPRLPELPRIPEIKAPELPPPPELPPVPELPPLPFPLP